MSAVSFGSTYRIAALKDYEKYGDMIDFCEDNNIKLCTKNEIKETKKKNGFYKVENKMTSTIIAPDSQDNLVEAFLANKGIKFNKLN